MRFALQLVVLVLLVAGCGSAREMSSAGVEPTFVSVPPGEITTEIVGATPAQKEILLDALSGVGDGLIERITLTEAEPGWGDEDGVGVSFEPRARAADDMRFSWEASLIGEALSERSRKLGLPPVAYVSIPGERSALGELDEPGGTKEAVTVFISRLEKASDRAGVKLREIEVLKPLRFAVAVTVEVPDPANFLDQRARNFFDRLGEGPGDFDLRFVDSKGSRISENWHAGSGGAVSIRPELQGCSPYLVSRPMTYEPPPCPIDAGSEIEFVPATKVTPKITGGIQVQRELLRQILAGLGPTRIDSVEVATDMNEEWRAPHGAVGIDVRSSTPDGFTHWQTRTLEWIFGRRSLELGLPEVWYIGDNGDQAGGLDFSEGRKDTPMTRERAVKVLHEVVALAKRNEASTRIRVFEPSRLAFAVEFRAANPAAFLRNGLRPTLAPIEDQSHDGLYVEVLDASGDRVLEAGSGVWVRPDLLSCSPYGYFGSPDRPAPPPCPAKSQSPNRQ